MTLSGSTIEPMAIVGVGAVRRGSTKGKNAVELCAEAVAAAVRDAGLAPTDVDGLLAITPVTEPHFMFGHLLAEHLGLEPDYCLTLQGGGVGPAGGLRTAAAAVALGFCNYAVVVEGDGRGSKLAGDKITAMAKARAWSDQWEEPHGTSTPAKYALVARRYLEATGATREHLARIAVAARGWAPYSPWAVFNSPLTVEEVLAGPPIADPLHKFDCCPVCDWGGAFVVTTPDRARRLRQPAVRLLGMGEAHAAFHPGEQPGLDSGTTRRAARQAFAQAGMGPGDFPVAQVFDAFTVALPIALEQMGFCPAGEGPFWATSSALTRQSQLPVNTFGGMLNCGNAHIYHILEGILQVRGQCGDRQVPGADRCLVHAQGGAASGAAVMVLGR